MDKTIVWGFRWAPPFAQGLVRDLRVRWALEEAGRAYESALIDLKNLDTISHRQKHPFAMVPVVETGGAILIESGAIVHGIAEESEALMPADRAGRNETLAWMFAALNTVEPSMQTLFSIDFLSAEEAWAPLRRPTMVETVKARLQALSTRLEGRDYLLGRFTAADILMATVLRFIRHTDLIAGFPTVDAYVERCQARPAFQRALASQMADYAANEPVAA